MKTIQKFRVRPTLPKRLAPLLDKYGAHWTFVGVIPPRALAAFFQSCDVTVLPSLNSTESFGLVQIESMICGTPVVASNLPGVRQPVAITGMGKVAAIGDAQSLANGILTVLANPGAFHKDSNAIRSQFLP